MLKIHKGLKKKKKDKKNKHKEDDLFNEEELEKYRKEHCSKPLEVEGEPAEASNSVQSDEWQKFKALTAGVDNILQKTQEDLDRIKSTSFFQRKAPPSEVEKQKEEERKQEEEVAREKEAEEQALAEKTQQEQIQFKLSESEEESEEGEVDDNIFDTSYVDAVASGELKLAYIPDSPDKEDDFDPFDTSYADKFIKTNPKKRYLNLGSAVQVLSGKGVSETTTLPSTSLERKSPRRRVKPVDLLLTSFDESDNPADKVLSEKTPVESPVKTLLDEDPDVDILPVAPIPAPVSTPIPFSTPEPVTDKKQEKLDFSDFEINEFDVLTTSTSLNLEKQASSESADDEFAQLAAESLARKSSSALPTPNEAPKSELNICRQPIKSFDAVTPTEFISVNPLQPAVLEEEEVDPFDTSIVDKIILPGKQEIKLLEKELLSDFKVPPQKRVDDIDDSDFDPRAGEPPVKAIRPQELVIKNKQIVEDHVSPSKKPDFLKIEEVDGEVTKPLTPLVPNCENLEEDYDPFDTSHIDGAPGKLELKLIENELIQQTQSLNEDDDFDPRKYEALAKTENNPPSVAHSILNKYSCNVEIDTISKVETPTIDILTGKEELPVEISHAPVEPEKFVVESPEINYTDPFDTSIADNIQPGKTELKILENEFISDN